jgi:alpha-ribazole phosphatase
MRLLLIRHAEAEESVRGRCYGSHDVGLSARGVGQCAELAAALADERLQRVVSSPRIRAVETARAVAEPHGVDVEVDARLRELDFGAFEGRTYDEIAAEHPELYAAWMTTPTEVTFPGGECYDDLRSRALAALADLRRAHVEGGGVAVVAHGGIVRALVAEILDVPAARIFRLDVEPASVAIVEWLGEEPILLRLGPLDSLARTSRLAP